MILNKIKALIEICDKEIEVLKEGSTEEQQLTEVIRNIRFRLGNIKNELEE